MKTHHFLLLTFLLGATVMLQSCARTGDDIWEDTKSASRHMNRGIRSLGGKQGDSRQVCSRHDFDCVEDEGYYPPANFPDCQYENNYEDQPLQAGAEFIPLEDPSHELSRGEMLAPPPRETPGDPGCSLPGIQAFRDPNTIPYMAGIFCPLYFDYDSSLIKGQYNLQLIHQIADYMRSHPNLYVFIEGHTDERGPQAYNLALGARRSNAVRNLLISEGVNPDHLFTISYGKERPVILEHHEEGWAKNRRAEFKVYER